LKLAFSLEKEIEFEKIMRKVALTIEKHSKQEGLSNSVLVFSIEKITQETELDKALISLPQL
jgi:hypothetical protein